MGKSKSTSSSTQKLNAYQPAQAGIDTGTAGLSDWMTGAGAAAYQGPRVADLSGATRSGVDNLTANTGAGAARDYYSGVLGGDWLNQDNPYLGKLQDAIKASIMPTLNSQFSGAGLTGSTLHQGAVSRELGRAMAEPLFGAYENERNRMDAAAGNIGNADNQMSNNYLTAGQILDSYAQNKIDANKQAFEDNRMAPVRGIMEALPTVNQIGSTYGTQTGRQTSSTKTPLGQQILGGAMMGVGALGGGGMGMIGNGLGNLVRGAPWSYGSSWAPLVQQG